MMCLFLHSQSILDAREFIEELGINLQSLLYLGATVDNRAMIAITNEFAHSGSRHLDEFLSHEHRHLTRLHVLTLAALAVDCSHRYLIMIADRLHDFIEGEHLVALLNLDGTLDDTLSQSDIDAAVIYNTVSQQTID